MNELIRELVENEAKTKDSKTIVKESDIFDANILDYQHTALEVWSEVIKSYHAKEIEFKIPYSIAETPKLYALDALAVIAPLTEDNSKRKFVAKLFVIFYLLVHFYDDHVEHLDKFYSKFQFKNDQNIDPQKGAAPFSFVLISYELILQEIQQQNAFSDLQTLALLRDINANLALQTQYFASERRVDLTENEVLRIKQEQVTGKSLSILAEFIKPLGLLDNTELRLLEKGLYYLGSLTQITDDIRDLDIDSTLKNANFINSSIACHGEELGIKIVSEIFEEHVNKVKGYLQTIYSEEDLKVILSLPFYPFIIDKRALRRMEIK